MQNWIQLESGLLVNLNHVHQISENWIITGLTESEARITPKEYFAIKARLFPTQAVELSVTSDDNVTVYELKDTSYFKGMRIPTDVYNLLFDLRYVSNGNFTEASFCKHILEKHNIDLSI